jgi:hypothetical protein
VNNFPFRPNKSETNKTSDSACLRGVRDDGRQVRGTKSEREVNDQNEKAREEKLSVGQ